MESVDRFSNLTARECADEVRADLLRRLAGHQIEIHSKAERKFDYLRDEFAFVIEVKNPFPGGIDLELEVADEITLFFGSWHAHYAFNLEEYEWEFLEGLQGFLAGKTSVISFWHENAWLSSSCSQNPLSVQMGWEALIAESFLDFEDKEMMPKLNRPGGLIKVENWFPEKSFQLTWPGMSSQSGLR